MKTWQKILLSIFPFMLSVIIIGVSTIYSQFFWMNRLPEGMVIDRDAFGLLVATGFAGLYFIMTLLPHKFGGFVARSYLFTFIIFTGVYGAVETHDIGLRQKTMQSESYQTKKRLLDAALTDVEVRNKKGWGQYKNTLPTLLGVQEELESDVENAAGTTSGLVQYASMQFSVPPAVSHGVVSAASSVALDVGVSLSNGLIQYIWFGVFAASKPLVVIWFTKLVTLVTALVTLVKSAFTRDGRKFLKSLLAGNGKTVKNGSALPDSSDNSASSGNSGNTGNYDEEIVRLCRTMKHKSGKHAGKPKYRDVAKIVGKSHVHCMNVYKRWQSGETVTDQVEQPTYTPVDVDAYTREGVSDEEVQQLRALNDYLTQNPNAGMSELRKASGAKDNAKVNRLMALLGKGPQ